jgi:predicted ArsR family transcriptional regulator
MLDAIMQAPGLGLTELADLTGLHVNTLRDHLRVLEDEGHVRSDVERIGKRGRPRLVFAPVGPCDRSAAAEKRLREAIRHGDLMRSLLPATESPLPAEATHQLDAAYHHLHVAGLQPEIDEETLTIGLVPCRFRHLLPEDPDAACRVHEELLRSVLGRAGGPLVVDRVLPLVTPRACRVHLAVQTEKTEDHGSVLPSSTPTNETPGVDR